MPGPAHAKSGSGHGTRHPVSVALTIDRAPARRLSDDEFLAWAQDQTVFLSSVMGELARERAALAAALDGLGFTVRWFEGFGGRDDSAGQAYLSEVRSSTVYVGLLGDRYGTMLASDPYAGYSATHAEYLEARALGKRVSFWERKPEDQRDGHARDFLTEVRLFHVTGSFADAADLPKEVERRLRELAAEDLSPWVKLGGIVVRATRLRVSGNNLQVEARLYDQGVVHAIEELAGGGQTRRRAEIQITQANRSGRGRIVELAVESTSAAFSDITAKVTADWSGGGDTGISTGGYSADDLTEVAMKVGLLGEDLPSELRQMSFLVKADDPLVELQALTLSEDSVQSLARLLIVEQLIGQRRAGAVVGFSLGPESAGARHLELTWRAPKRYVNVEPHLRSIKGVRHR